MNRGDVWDFDTNVNRLFKREFNFLKIVLILWFKHGRFPSSFSKRKEHYFPLFYSVFSSKEIGQLSYTSCLLSWLSFEKARKYQHHMVLLWCWQQTRYFPQARNGVHFWEHYTLSITISKHHRRQGSGALARIGSAEIQIKTSSLN